jgi:hypothetical protein
VPDDRDAVPDVVTTFLTVIKAGARRVIQRCQVHKVLYAMAICYVSAVRSSSTQPAAAVK